MQPVVPLDRIGYSRDLMILQRPQRDAWALVSPPSLRGTAGDIIASSTWTKTKKRGFRAVLRVQEAFLRQYVLFVDRSLRLKHKTQVVTASVGHCLNPMYNSRIFLHGVSPRSWQMTVPHAKISPTSIIYEEGLRHRTWRRLSTTLCSFSFSSANPSAWLWSKPRLRSPLSAAFTRASAASRSFLS